MACLAFELHPRPVDMQDLFGAVEVEPNQPENQTDYSMQALKRSAEMHDLDAALEQDLEKRAEFAARQRALLEGAGYQAAALALFDERFL